MDFTSCKILHISDTGCIRNTLCESIKGKEHSARARQDLLITLLNVYELRETAPAPVSVG